jgi:sulfur-oxidizing protein SoxY
MKRRLFIQHGLTSATTLIAAQAGLLFPLRVQAAWPADAFAQQDYQAAFRAFFGDVPVMQSEGIGLTAPDIAENGATVQITVVASLPEVESITVFGEKNPFPLIASFTFTSAARPVVTTRIKMADTSDVIAVVRSAGRCYSARKRVKVTAGGCT